MKRINTVEELTSIVGDGYFTDISKGKVFLYKTDGDSEDLIQAILNKAVIMVTNKCKNKTHYCLFDTVSEARRCFNDIN